MFNLVYLEDGLGVVDSNGKIRMLSKEEEDKYWEKETKRGNRIFWIWLIIFLFSVSYLGYCISSATTSYFLKPPAQINCIESTTKNLLSKKIKIRAIVADNTSPREVSDPHIARLLSASNAEFDNFFAGTTAPLRQEITIFFIDQKYWDGEKICQWSESGGCNIQTKADNIILIPLSQDLYKDLRTLNHERAHAYFLNEPEITAHLVEYLFATNRDLSQYMFPLYRDRQGKLRF